MIVDALDVLREQGLMRIVGAGKQVMDNGACHFDEIWLIGEKSSAHLSVNCDTDEIVIAAAALGSADGEDIGGLAEYLNQSLGCYWFCENSQGYFDMLIISVAGIDPQIGFLGVASAIEIKRVMNL